MNFDVMSFIIGVAVGAIIVGIAVLVYCFIAGRKESTSDKLDRLSWENRSLFSAVEALRVTVDELEIKIDAIKKARKETKKEPKE